MNRISALLLMGLAAFAGVAQGASTPITVPEETQSPSVYDFDPISKLYPFIDESAKSCNDGKKQSCEAWSDALNMNAIVDDYCQKRDGNGQCISVGIPTSESTARGIFSCSTRTVIIDGLAFQCTLCCIRVPKPGGGTTLLCPPVRHCVQEMT